MFNKHYTQTNNLEEIEEKNEYLMNRCCGNLGDLVMADTNSETPCAKGILTLSNCHRVVLNYSNEINLNHGLLIKWTHEIEDIQRGQEIIIFIQSKPGN